MAGYCGCSMSNNAVSAYEHGEKPLSKWTKATILKKISDSADIDPEKMNAIEKMTAKELKDNFLNLSSWHHTGKFYNITQFYELDIERIENITTEEIERIFSKRPERKRRTKEEIAADKAAKEQRRAEKEAKEEKEKLFKYQTKCKTLSGFMRSDKIDLEDLRSIRKQRIEEKREYLLQIWTKQGNKSKLEKINDDDFVEKYIK